MEAPSADELVAMVTEFTNAIAALKQAKDSATKAIKSLKSHLAGIVAEASKETKKAADAVVRKATEEAKAKVKAVTSKVVAESKKIPTIYSLDYDTLLIEKVLTSVVLVDGAIITSCDTSKPLMITNNPNIKTWEMKPHLCRFSWEPMAANTRRTTV